MDFSDSSPSSSAQWRSFSEENQFYRPRPQSRRGFQEGSNLNQSANSRHSAMRPGSAYRGSTGSRIATASFGQPPSTPMLRSGAVTGFNVMDRPITQQGLSGLRTSTARGFRTRQLQDKRYWEDLLQTKMRELRTEIARLNKKSEVGNRERSANKLYEARVKELAQELTDLQGRLSDYNMSIRLATEPHTVREIELQTKELQEANDGMLSEVEQVFTERQRKEAQLKQVNEQINKEQSARDSFVVKMSPTERERYNKLNDSVVSLQKEAEEIKSKISEMSREKDDINKTIAFSQMKMHMVEMQRRLLASEEKRNSLKNEMVNRLLPQQERDQLLAQVREDNAAITSMENSASSLKEEIKRTQELIEQADQDLEEGQSERHQKYQELRKREEIMESFTSTYEDNFKREQDKIAQLENNIVFSLENSSANIDIDLDEIDALKKKDDYDSAMDGENDTSRSAEMLAKDYERLKANIKKAELTRERLSTETATIPERITSMRAELNTISNLERLRSDAAARHFQLESEVNDLKSKIAPTESAVVEATAKYRDLQQKLDGNEMYAKLNGLEEKLIQLQNSNSVLKEDIASITLKTDYEPLKVKALEAVASLNEKLKMNLNDK